MNRKALLVSAVAVSISMPAWAQSSDTGPGNPTLLDAIRDLQNSVNTLQGTVNRLSATVNGIVTDGVSANPRLFYLTQTTADGAHAPAACTAGFHMASLWEIFDPSNLAYESSLGFKQSDSGQGPPAGPSAEGWIRTGSLNNNGDAIGHGNCLSYTSAASGDSGTVAVLDRTWVAPFPPATSVTVHPWNGSTDKCSVLHKVWCVQN